MYMVENSANSVAFTSCVTAHGGKVSIKRSAYFVTKAGDAILSAEYDVDNDQTQRLWHSSSRLERKESRRDASPYRSNRIGNRYRNHFIRCPAKDLSGTWLRLSSCCEKGGVIPGVS